MKLLICGDRNWKHKELIKKKVTELLSRIDEELIVIEGEASGADSLGREVAEELGLEVLKYPAEWSRYHKAAGPIRNTQMLLEGKPDLVYAFHNNIDKSSGTKDMVRKSRKVGIPTEVFTIHD